MWSPFLFLGACAGSPPPAGDVDVDVGSAVDGPDLPYPMTFYQDLDGDGLGSDVSKLATTPGSGWVSVTGDCDDENRGVGGPTTWYVDRDGDGHGIPDETVAACVLPAGASATADDCDDTDRAVYPGAPPICGDHVVNDCDGPADPETDCAFEGDRDLESDRWRWTGRGSAELGAAVGAADVDGDGVPELLLGAPDEDHDAASAWEGGSVYVVEADATPGPADAAATTAWYGDESDPDVQQTGRGADGVGDLDGDGREEIFVASGETGFLLSGAEPGVHDIGASAVATFPGEATSHGGFTSLPDPEVPGARLLVIGAADEHVVDRVRLFRGPLVGTVEASDAWMTLEMPSPDTVGAPAAIDGDGDGQPGVAAIALRRQRAADCDNSEDVYVTDVLAGGTWRPDDVADVHLTSCDARLRQVGNAGDVDGDGYEDLIVGTYGVQNVDEPAAWAGFLYYGPVDRIGAQVAEDAASVIWTSNLLVAGAPVAGGDLDGDGLDDVVMFGAWWDHYGQAPSVHGFYVFEGPLAGSLDVAADATASFQADRASDETSSLRFVGDVDRDGRDDLLIGVPAWDPYPDDDGYVYHGAAFLVLGGEVF